MMSIFVIPDLLIPGAPAPAGCSSAALPRKSLTRPHRLSNRRIGSKTHNRSSSLACHAGCFPLQGVCARRRHLHKPEQTLFFDLAADLAQMFAERMARVRDALGKVVGELQLLTQRFTGFDSLGLFAFRRPDLARGLE